VGTNGEATLNSNGRQLIDFCTFNNLKIMDTPLKQYKGRWNRHWERMENLQNILKSATNESLGVIKRRNRRKYLKIWDDQIKQLIETKKKII